MINKFIGLAIITPIVSSAEEELKSDDTKEMVSLDQFQEWTEIVKNLYGKVNELEGEVQELKADISIKNAEM